MCKPLHLKNNSERVSKHLKQPACWSQLERCNSINLFHPPINGTTAKRPSVENANKIRLFIIFPLCRRIWNKPGRYLSTMDSGLHYIDKTISALLKKTFNNLFYSYFIRTERTVLGDYRSVQYSRGR